MDYKRLTDNIIYNAYNTSNSRTCKEHFYFGFTETTFEKRYGNHEKSFNFYKYKNGNELS